MDPQLNEYTLFYHLILTLGVSNFNNNISNNYLTWDGSNSLHYIRMQENKLAEIHYICRLLIFIFLYTHEPLALDKLMAQQAE